MVSQSHNHKTAKFLQFSPYLTFLSIYAGLYWYTFKNFPQSTTPYFFKLALCTIILTLLYAFFTFSKEYLFEKKLHIFLSGIAQPKVIEISLYIILLSMYNNMITHINGVLTAVTICLYYIPTTYMMPSLFILISLISYILKTFIPPIILCMPIAYGIAISLALPKDYVTATILSGALCGYHLHLYVQTVLNEKYKSKFLELPHALIIPSAIATLYKLTQYQCQTLHPSIYHDLYISLAWHKYILILPYILIFAARVLRINFIVTMIAANIITLCIGVLYHNMPFVESLLTLLTNFTQNPLIFSILLQHLLIAGLCNVIKYNHGFDYIMRKMYKSSYNFITAQLSTLILIILNNLLLKVDNQDITTHHYTLKKITEKYKISLQKITALNDIVIPTLHCIIPYSLVMIVSCSFNHTEYQHIMYYMMYPTIFMGMILASISIFHLKYEKRK